MAATPESQGSPYRYKTWCGRKRPNDRIVPAYAAHDPSARIAGRAGDPSLVLVASGRRSSPVGAGHGSSRPGATLGGRADAPVPVRTKKKYLADRGTDVQV